MFKLDTLPGRDASFAELRRHFIQVNDFLAALPYEVAIHVCKTCLKDGENSYGKGSGGRLRYCSEHCEALAERYRALMPKPGESRKLHAGAVT